MKKLLALLTSIAVFAICNTPALASPAPVRLQVNGKNMPTQIPPQISEGYTLVPVRAISEALGADVGWDAGTEKVTIRKNSDIIELTIGKKEVYKNGIQFAVLNVSPQIVDNKTLIPGRVVLEALGATVGWDGATQTVTVEFSETKDGMTPEELMAKASEAMLNYSTYKFAGTSQVRISITGRPLPAVSNVNFEGSCRQNSGTTGVYWKQTVELPGAEGVPAGSLTIENYSKGPRMYQRMEGANWQELNLSMYISEFLNQNPQQAIQMMKDYGLLLAHGNPENIDGKDYYILVVKVDGEKYKQFNNFNIDMNEKIYIDKDTMSITRIKLADTVSTVVDGQDIVTETESIVNISNFNADVTWPDVARIAG